MTCINVTNYPTPIGITKNEDSILVGKNETALLVSRTIVPAIYLSTDKTPINIHIDGDCRYMALMPMPDFSFYIAGESIAAFSVVYQGNDELIYRVDLDIEEQLLLNIKGVLVNSVNNGDRGQVQLNGELYNGSWNWAPELPVYLTSIGDLTQDIPEEWVYMEIGRALSETTILLDLEEPIVIVP
jgi:hypothetical protein